MEDLKDFHDTHDSLANWLTAKEKMMTVLGPISSDSRMVQSQVQQVQVSRPAIYNQVYFIITIFNGAVQLGVA